MTFVPGTSNPREFSAVVAPSGGDFTSIAAAFAAGNQTVFVQEGTYDEDSDIEIPAGGYVTGASSGSVIVNLIAGAKVSIDGSGRATVAGTISVASGDATVHGVGTSFTSLQAGDYIVLGQGFYEIASVTDDTTLVLVAPWEGAPIAGQTMQGQSMVVSVGVENLSLIAPGQTAIRVIQGFRCAFQRVVVRLSGDIGIPAWRVTDSGNISIVSCSVDDNEGTGLIIDGSVTRSRSIFILASVARNNKGSGFSFEQTDVAAVTSCLSFANANDGVTVIGASTAIQMINSFINLNRQKGVDISASASDTVVANCTISGNGDHAVDFNGADFSIVEGCLISDNAGTGINGGSNGIVDGCHIRDNGGAGIDMQATANDSAVTSCVVDGNAGTGIIVSGESTISANRVRDNGVRGIDIQNAADDGTLVGNVVSGNTGIGIRIQNTANNWVVTGNRSTGNGGANFSNLSGTTTLGANNFT